METNNLSSKETKNSIIKPSKNPQNHNIQSIDSLQITINSSMIKAKEISQNEEKDKVKNTRGQKL